MKDEPKNVIHKPEDAAESELSGMPDSTYVDDLYDVGPKKPMGYLPIETLVKLDGIPLKEAIEKIEASGNSWKTYEMAQCSVWSGALYVWNESALGELISRHRDIVKAYGWPTDASGFANKVATETVPMGTEIYRVVGQSFNDSRFLQNTQAHVRSAANVK